MTGVEVAIASAVLGAGVSVAAAASNNNKAPTVKDPIAPPVANSRTDTGAIVKLGADSKNDLVKSKATNKSPPKLYDFLGNLGKGTGVQV